MYEYTFPHITHISQCLTAIEGCDSFIVAERDRHTIINYVNMGNETFPDVTPPVESWFGISNRGPYLASLRRECRGIVFGPDGRVIARRLHKFFNAGERDEVSLDKIDLSQPHVTLEKLDGSMITPIPIGDHIRWGTKMGLTSVGFQVEEYLAGLDVGYRYFSMAEHYCEFGSTLIFEWCSRKQRIVVDYPKDELVLTAIRNNITGEYLPHADLLAIGKFWGVPVVQASDGNAPNITELVESTRSLGTGGAFEGVVVRFDSGHMIKVKTDDYVRIHRAKDSILQEKRVVEMVLNEKVDDVLPHLIGHDKEALSGFQMAFWRGMLQQATRLAHLYELAFVGHNGDKKKFAIASNGHLTDTDRSIIFSVWGRASRWDAEDSMYDILWQNARDAVMDELKKRVGKNLGSQTNVDGARWMWGGVSWKEFIQQESDSGSDEG